MDRAASSFQIFGKVFKKNISMERLGEAVNQPLEAGEFDDEQYYCSLKGRYWVIFVLDLMRLMDCN